MAELLERSLLVTTEHEQLLKQEKRAHARESELTALVAELQAANAALQEKIRRRASKHSEVVAKYGLVQEQLQAAERERQQTVQTSDARHHEATSRVHTLQQQLDEMAQRNEELSGELVRVETLSKGRVVEMSSSLHALQADLAATHKELQSTTAALAAASGQRDLDAQDLATATEKIEKLKEIATYNKDRYNEMVTWRDLATARETDLRQSNALLREQLLAVQQKRDALATSIQFSNMVLKGSTDRKDDGGKIDGRSAVKSDACSAASAGQTAHTSHTPHSEVGSQGDAQRALVAPPEAADDASGGRGAEGVPGVMGVGGTGGVGGVGGVGGEGAGTPLGAFFGLFSPGNA